MLAPKKNTPAAAVVAALSLPAMAFAAPVQLPYYTNFSTTPDSAGNTYTNGALQGQAPGTGTGTTGWVNENGETNDAATVAGAATGNGTVTLTSTSNGGTPAAPVWSDVYNSNLADHPSAPGNGNGLPLSSTPYGNQLSINYSLDVLSGVGSLGANGTAAASYGVRVLDASDNLLAALFVKGDPTVPGQENVLVQTGTGSAEITGLTGPANGTTGKYTINLDLQHSDFTVFVNGFKTTTIPFGAGETGVTSIGGITLATDNLGGGGNQGVFSSFSVLPEPTGFVVMGLGGLVLLARRPKHAAQ